VRPSWDGKYVAYVSKINNADLVDLKVMEVDTGRILETDTIRYLLYGYMSWTPDNRGFYYTWFPPDRAISGNERLAKADIRYHTIGTSPSNDRIVKKGTGDPSKWINAEVSEDGSHLFVTISNGKTETDLYVKNIKTPGAPFRTLAQGNDARYYGLAHKGTIFVLTNEDAPRYRVFAVDPRTMQREAWKEIVPQDPEAVIQELRVIGGHLVLKILKRVASEIQIRALGGDLVRQVSLPCTGTVSDIVGTEVSDTAFFTFESLNRPQEIFALSISTGEISTFAKTDAAVDPNSMEIQEVFYKSKDGTRISMFLAYRKGMEKNGRARTLLAGYGGFNIAWPPYFSERVLAWVEDGGLFAFPHLRGGGEYGEGWHRAGMLDKKQNVFDDFISAAEWLIANGYTRPVNLGIFGGSNGGLLVGAVMVQRPELFGAVVCTVPILDMLRYHKFGVGKAWIPEYGDPDDPEDFKWLYAYSPYHKLRRDTVYPPLLLQSADSDDRVDPMHARKFLAAVQWAQKGEAPAILHIERNAGHMGADLRRKRVEEISADLAFLKHHLSQ
jgi:prolyl oligopeptidase